MFLIWVDRFSIGFDRVSIDVDMFSVGFDRFL